MRVFIGSSSEAVQRGTVTTLARWLEELGQEPLRWDDPGAFPAGQYILARLSELSSFVDGAVLVFGEDDKVWYRGELVAQPRDNVLLEYGLFTRALASEKVLIVREGQPRIPSDLGGIVHVPFAAERLNQARAHVSAWVESLTAARRIVWRDLEDARRATNALLECLEGLSRDTTRHMKRLLRTALIAPAQLPEELKTPKRRVAIGLLGDALRQFGADLNELLQVHGQLRTLRRIKETLDQAKAALAELRRRSR